MAKDAGAPVLSARDEDLLRLLDRTPLTTALILRASETFGGEPFRDERRVRERLQTLAAAGLVRAWPLSLSGGGSSNYYKLTAEGYRLLHGPQTPLPHHREFDAVRLARLQHTQTLAEIIVHTLVAAHRHRVGVSRFHKENSLTLTAGHYEQRPDCAFQFHTSGRTFNLLFEIDNNTEPIDANSHQSIRLKILGYEAYQDRVWQIWKRSGGRGPRPLFRVVFLTRSIDRAYHILSSAGELAGNKDRRLCYAATQDSFLADVDPLRVPIFLDHQGQWHALVNVHPTAVFPKAPVRLPRFLATTFPV
jgi:hypothetical protein